jgi:hypothetical protein
MQSQVSPGLKYDYPYRSGVNVGVFAEWLNNAIISLNTELTFIQKGHQLDIPVTTEQLPDGTGEFYTESIRLNYISVGILPKLRLSFDATEFYVLAGPRVDFALSHSADVDGREPFRSILEAGWNSNLNHYKDAQLGGDFALGIATSNLLPIGLGLEVRYSPDFTPSSQLPNFSMTNHSWEFLLVLVL